MMLWRLLGFLGISVKEDDPSVHHRAIEDAGDSFPALDPQLEQTSLERPSVGHSQISTELKHQVGEPEITSRQALWQLLHKFLYIFVVVLDPPSHGEF